MDSVADLLMNDQAETINTDLLNTTTVTTTSSTTSTATVYSRNDAKGFANPLETWHIILIAVSVCLIITALVILLVLWKWRRKRGKKDSSVANGTFYDREPLFNHRPAHPEIVITEPTNIDSSSYSPSAHGTNSEVYSAKSVTHVPPCVLAEIEDLDASELVSPATTENNLRISPGIVSIQMTPANNHSSGQGLPVISQQVHHHAFSPGVNETVEKNQASVDGDAARSGRSQSIGSASSYNERLYTKHSPHGMLPYGIGDYTATVFLDDNDNPDNSIPTHLPECDQLLTDR